MLQVIAVNGGLICSIKFIGARYYAINLPISNLAIPAVIITLNFRLSWVRLN
jgi:hypothetical protein